MSSLNYKLFPFRQHGDQSFSCVVILRRPTFFHNPRFVTVVKALFNVCYTLVLPPNGNSKKSCCTVFFCDFYYLGHKAEYSVFASKLGHALATLGKSRCPWILALENCFFKSVNRRSISRFCASVRLSTAL